MTIKDKTWKRLELQWRQLLTALKKDIGDDYRCSDDPDDKTPGMLVTFGVTANTDGTISWAYQTGDNSYSGGAYGHRTWALVYLYRRSNCTTLAAEAIEEAISSIQEAA